MWVKSFQRVNLQPSTRRPFKEWCSKILEALQTGMHFKMEEFCVDPYLALPYWWKEYPVEIKKEAMKVVESHKGKFNINCLMEIKKTFHVPFSDMQNFRLCYELSKDNPSLLNRTEIEKESLNDSNEELVNIHLDSEKEVNKGLESFMLCPPGLKGHQLFNHQVIRRELMFKTHTPSKYIHVEVTKDNEKVLGHTRTLLLGEQLPAKRIIFSDSYGTNAKHKLSKRKLDSWGSIKSHCSLANSQKKLARYKNMLEMADFIAEIEKGNAKKKKKRKSYC